MRNLIPRLQVVVARDRARADRVLADLTPGQELFLSPLTGDLFKISDSADESARVLGMVPGEWSSRIAEVEASGRQCRAWFVGELPFEKSPDGSYRIVVTVWCSSLNSRTGWRDLSADELLQAARLYEDRPAAAPRRQSPFQKSRLFQDDAVQQGRVTPASSAAPASQSAPLSQPQAGAVPQGQAQRQAPSAGSASGLRPEQVALIREAVQRRLAAKKE